MRVLVGSRQGTLSIEDPSGVLSATHMSQLSFWGLFLSQESTIRSFIGPYDADKLLKVVAYLQKDGISVDLNRPGYTGGCFS